MNRIVVSPFWVVTLWISFAHGTHAGWRPRLNGPPAGPPAQESAGFRWSPSVRQEGGPRFQSRRRGSPRRSCRSRRAVRASRRTGRPSPGACLGGRGRWLRSRPGAAGKRAGTCPLDEARASSLRTPPCTPRVPLRRKTSHPNSREGCTSLISLLGNQAGDHPVCSLVVRRAGKSTSGRNFLPQFPKALLKEAALRFLLRQGQGPFVGFAGLGRSAQPAAEIGTGRVSKVVIGELPV